MNWKVAAGALLVAAAALACRDATRPEQNVAAAQAHPVPGEYIVVFQPSVANPAALRICGMKNSAVAPTAPITRAVNCFLTRSPHLSDRRM